MAEFDAKAAAELNFIQASKKQSAAYQAWMDAACADANPLQIERLKQEWRATCKEVRKFSKELEFNV